MQNMNTQLADGARGVPLPAPQPAAPDARPYPLVLEDDVLATRAPIASPVYGFAYGIPLRAEGGK